jgi:hypothetical protein|nr:MAG TPA: hypothetical protein [Caudoviricetes sp.]
MDMHAATQAFNEAATKAWTNCDIVGVPGCPGFTFAGPACPTEGFFVAIAYNGREIARVDGDGLDPMTAHFYPTPREVVALADFKHVIKMIRQGFLLPLDSDFNYWLANSDSSSYHWEFDSGIGVVSPAEA